MNGSRNSSWRESDRNMDFLTIPRHWKKLPDAMPNPTRAKPEHMMRIPLAASALSSGSLVKSPTAISGMNMATRKQRLVTSTSHLAVSTNISLTRLYWRAP